MKTKGKKRRQSRETDLLKEKEKTKKRNRGKERGYEKESVSRGGWCRSWYIPGSPRGRRGWAEMLELPIRELLGVAPR